MTTPQRLETVRRLQTAMATAYAGMGAWCLFHPSSVLSLSLTPAYQPLCNTTTSIFVRCFGAQAMTCGLVLGTATMTPYSFTAFGTAMASYILWNLWVGIGPGRGVLTSWIWLDFLGNVFYAAGCFYCAQLLREEQRQDLKGK